MSKGDKPSQVIIIGASAGGIEAVGKVLASLPADIPAPLIIAQHIAPAGPSHLMEVLTHRSALPVCTVADGERLEAGVVYLVPQGQDLEIAGCRAALCANAGRGPKPSVDRLLSSAATAYGEGLVAVILSGTGSDGAAGARVVKQHGGTVVIEDPRTARFPGMPQSLAPATVDVVADVEHIGSVLENLLAGANAAPLQGSEQTLDALLEDVRARCGVDFNSYKRPTIQRRLRRRMAATGAADLGDYQSYLRRHPEEYQRLVASFLVKVTEFFRDPDMVAHLREYILPAVIERAHQNGHEIRLWSAGCATGEEAYSLAILLCEALDTDPDRFQVRIFATDVDGEAVAFARRGVYPASALTGVAPQIVDRYFRHQHGEYAVDKRVRSLIVFGQHDLGQRPPFPNIGLILCRNVLIYFTAELQRRALHLFAFALHEGGYLVLGKAETANVLTEFLRLEHPALKVYRRHGERILVPAARINEILPLAPMRENVPRQTPGERDLTGRAASPPGGRGMSETFAEVFLRAPVGIVVVNASYDIQYINETARALLGIRGAAIGDDLVHLSRGAPPRMLQRTIDAVFAKGTPVRPGEVELEDPGTASPRHVEVVAYPCLSAGARTPEFVAIALTDVTPRVLGRRRLEDDLTTVREERDGLVGQTEPILQANQELEAANRELAAENMQLRAANEDFQVDREEVQAASEEVETLNEELQATNEELETLNEELQATIEELNTANEDLLARSNESHERAAASDTRRHAAERERDRLEAVMASMASALAVVDRTGHLLLSNEVHDRTFGTEWTDLHAEAPDGRPLSPADLPWQRAVNGEPFRMEFVLTSPDGDRRWFEAGATPLPGGWPGLPDTGDGGHASSEASVISIRDITDRSVRRLQDEFLATASHELRTPLAALTLYAGLLPRLVNPSDEEGRVHQVAQAVLTQAARLRSLVEDLVDVGRLDRGQLTIRHEPLDIRTVLSAVVDAGRAMPHGQSLRLHLPESAVLVTGDASRLEQVFMNLVDNALKYASGQHPVDIRLGVDGSEVEVEVQDYGPGIPADELPGVFDRFHRLTHSAERVQGGLGLGLYIVKQLVEAHGGTVGAQSVEGEGMVFRVRLPLVPAD